MGVYISDTRQGHTHQLKSALCVGRRDTLHSRPELGMYTLVRCDIPCARAGELFKRGDIGVLVSCPRRGV